MSRSHLGAVLRARSSATLRFVERCAAVLEVEAELLLTEQSSVGQARTTTAPPTERAAANAPHRRGRTDPRKRTR